MEKSNRKRWTEEEVEIILSNWDNSLSINQNVRNLSVLLPNRTLDAIKRELYDFSRRGTLKMKQGKLYPR
jgi:hypothetical protein